MPAWRRVRTGVSGALRFVLERGRRPRWTIRPGRLVDQDVVLLASFSRDGAIAERTRRLCSAWHAAGFRVVLIVACDAPDPRRPPADAAGCLEGLMFRRNAGYDFGSWAEGLRSIDDLDGAAILALANDSVYGPLDGFDRFIERVRRSAADIVGVVESFERVRHVQSFLVFYRRSALVSDAFRRFWKAAPRGGREDVITHYELRLLFEMTVGGLKADILYPYEGDRSEPVNPTLVRWRALLDAGFPFVKVELLRDNPHGADLDGWDLEMERRGYEPSIVARDLGARFGASAAGRTPSTQAASRLHAAARPDPTAPAVPDPRE